MSDLKTTLENIEIRKRNLAASVSVGGLKSLSPEQKEEARQRALEIAESKGAIVEVKAPIAPSAGWIVPVTKKSEPAKALSAPIEVKAPSVQPVIVSERPAKKTKVEPLDYNSVRVVNGVHAGRLVERSNWDSRPIEAGFTSASRSDRINVLIEGVRESRKGLEDLPECDSLVMYNDGVRVSYTPFGRGLEQIAKEAILKREVTKAIITLQKGRNHKERSDFPNGLTITLTPNVKREMQVLSNCIAPPTAQRVLAEIETKEDKPFKVGLEIYYKGELLYVAQFANSYEAFREGMKALQGDAGVAYFVLSNKVFDNLDAEDKVELRSDLDLTNQKTHAFIHEVLSKIGFAKSSDYQAFLKSGTLKITRSWMIKDEDLPEQPGHKKGPVMHVRRTTTGFRSTKKAPFFKQNPWMRGG